MHLKGTGENFQLKKQKIYPLGIEGKKDSPWVLMDYNEVFCMFLPMKQEAL